MRQIYWNLEIAFIASDHRSFMKTEQEIRKCTITECQEQGFKKYDLFSDKPKFMQLLLCKKHSDEADKNLSQRRLKVKSNGSYSKIKMVLGD